MILGDPQFRASILASAIVALLVLLVIQPLLSIAPNVLAWLGDNVYQGINNIIYSSAATHSGDALALLILFFVFLFGISGFIFIVTYIVTRLSAKTETVLHEISLHLGRYDEDPQPSESMILDKFEKTEDKRIYLSEIWKNLENKAIKLKGYARKVKILIASINIFLTVLFIGFMAFQSIKVELNRSFSQYLTVLAPHISETRYEELRASWVLMQNREDYQTIVAEIVQLASEKGIGLPESFWD